MSEPVGDGAQEQAYRELGRILRNLNAQTGPEDARAQIEEVERLREAEGRLGIAGRDK